MQLHVVGHTATAVLRVLGDLFSKLSGDHGSLWFERLKLMLQEKNPFAELKSAAIDQTQNWRAQLVREARKKLRRFSSAWAKQVTPPPAEWTEEFLTNAAMYNLRPVFFPAVTLDEKFLRRGYVKPGSWVYRQVVEGAVDRTVLTLKSGWALADFSNGVDYTNGTQVLPRDPWAPLLTRLRTVLKVLGKYGDALDGSRFAITHDEWIQVVLAHMASALNITRAKISLERMAEFNFIGNVYDAKRGKFDLWEWLEDELVGGARLLTGCRDDGGIAAIASLEGSRRRDWITARPLVRFF
ncbi:MAG: hypothetical protein KBC02_00685 [Candidatus Pacebacteria bacterium]|nr:hypothetical protein [Candidatus Paceibacterota bacterium]